MRGEELVLLSHAAPSHVALLGLVDKVEREREPDGTRKLIAYVTVCVQGNTLTCPIRLRAKLGPGVFAHVQLIGCVEVCVLGHCVECTRCSRLHLV